MSWEKIDKFYLFLTAILILMSVLIVVSAQGVITMFITSRELDPNMIGTETRVEKEKLNEAYNFAFNKSVVKLVLPQ